MDRPDFDLQIGAAFEAARAAHADLTTADLLREMKVARPPATNPSFDPARVAYYPAIRTALELTPQEQEIYKRTGIVGVDYEQRTTMAGAYLAIYRRDLPVLITSDSILNAMHRSFDHLLMEIEASHFIPALKAILAGMHARLQADPAANGKGNAAVRKSIADVEMYLTVARSLLVGLTAGADCRPFFGQDCPEDKNLALEPPNIRASFDGNDKAKEVVRAILAAKTDTGPSIYGRPTSTLPTIDWTQFQPRGHYTKTWDLKRYFRTMMWLGRVDVGFRLAPASGAFGGADADRELRDATLLALLVRQAGQADALEAMNHAIGFLVGLSDNATVADLAAAAERVGIREAADLAGADSLERLRAELGARGRGAQRIRSQLGYRAPGGGPETPLPQVAQLFGQRFVIDSFVMSKLVFDSIQFQGKSVERSMPSGLDVMAALGNDEAVGLLEPELDKWHYAANLLAARQVVEDRPAAAWDASQYDLWLSAIARLDDIPAGTQFPEVMRSQAWARKQLQTQLGSWAELRHDTVLYAKQSYTMRSLCEYPTGYVEPYPEFYVRLARFAELAASRLGAAHLGDTTRVSGFFKRFAEIMRRLERLARKELAAQPFDGDDKTFIKTTIQAQSRGGGCGGPTVTYTGWYPELIYASSPEEWAPTVADVHTGEDGVLEVGVGDVDFLVAAIDNGGDRAAYVGPVYSYYELTSQTRLTDEEWRAKIQEGKPPPRPEWVHVFQAKAKQRNLFLPPKH